MSFGSCKGVELLRHAIKIVERVLKSNTIISLNKMRFRFILQKETGGITFVVKKMLEQHQKRKRSCVYVLLSWIRNLIRVPREMMELGMTKEGFICSNGWSSYELVCWCKDKSEGGISVFIGV